ncbi:MAG: peptidase T [Lachnospiraceae bacterium]|nr:peptidase T [Lachnospiraceae bacterium]
MKDDTVINNFFRYIKYDTQSQEDAQTFPSTEKQKKLGKLLYEELKKMGASDPFFDDTYGYVYAKIPANCQDGDGKVLGFISHMDTSPETSGANIHARLVKDYNGGDICLNEKENIILSPREYPELRDYIGKQLIVTDGTTLLGADDKAGVAEIMTMTEYLLAHPEIKHREIAIAFTPDEEVGSGVDHFDLKRFGADYAYTVDGGAIGELEYENFNAAFARIEVHGVTVHPGEAKNKMKNASRIAMEFDKNLPEQQRPEYTQGYEGFFHLTNMEGGTEQASLQYIIRDHDRERFEEKKVLLKQNAEFLNAKYGMGTVQYQIKDSYYNMKEKIEPEYLFLIEKAKACMEELSIVPKIQPIRGGTDGARLSFMGLPCPNLCTGGHNFHGRFEYCCVESMQQIVRLLLLLAQK